MSDWNPDLYRRFEDERTRPSHDLLARVVALSPPGPAVRHAVDLGCGLGNSTELVAARYPDADVRGIDNSEAMLASARQRLPALRFDFADIADTASWQPPADAPAPDLIFANAVLQWPGHAQLLPRLFPALEPGGVLAVQMPDNLDEPSHRLMREVAALPPFATHIAAHIGDAGAVRERPLSPAQYHDLLVPTAAHVDIWHTVYQHPLASPAAIVDWLRSTGLRPFLDALPEPERAGFLADYQARIAAAYPPRADGRRLLAFPRLFIVARRRT